MSLGDGMLRPPNLGDDLNDLNRRLRVVEFGDPYDVNSRIADIPAQVKALTDPALRITYDNDGLISNYTFALINNLFSWITPLNNYVGQIAMWYIHQHENTLHPPSGAQGVANFPLGGTPVIPNPSWPTQPNLILPTIVIP